MDSTVLGMMNFVVVAVFDENNWSIAVTVLPLITEGISISPCPTFSVKSLMVQVVDASDG